MTTKELKEFVKKVKKEYHCRELDSLVDILCTMKFDGELSENDYDYILDHLDEFTNLE